MGKEHPGFGRSYWAPRIEEDGREVYRETDLSILGGFKAYWGWDAADRVWLYHADGGQIYYWDHGPEGWTRHEWDRQRPGEIGPPEFVLPDYVREMRKGR